MKDSTKKFAVGTLVAAAAGYLTGILTAPQSGKQTRQDIKDTATQGILEAERQLKKLHTELNDGIAEGRERLDQLSGKAHRELEAILESAHTAKAKAREILSTVHEGRAEDKELNIAIKEAKDAIAHLKSYLKKRH